MVERCSRTQCDAPATARVTFDALGAFVWIDRFEAGGPHDVGARGAGALCTPHADLLVAPRGWTVQDRRGRAPRLWSDRPAPADPPGAAPAAEVDRVLAEPSSPLLSRAFNAAGDRHAGNAVGYGAG